MYKIKHKIDDFCVEESVKLDLTSKKKDYTYFILEKRNWNTNDAIKAIASRLKVKPNRFNVAGIKDRKAITRQYVSAYRINKNELENLKIKDLKIIFVGYGEERLKLGQIECNNFKIIVRNLDKKYDKIKFIENYFDDQRFGGKNIILGKALVKKEFRKACYSLRLRWKEGDYVNPLRTLGKKLLRFYINSYQSLLFNEVLRIYFSRRYKDFKNVEYSHGEFIFSSDKIKNIKVPILGFLTEFDNEEIKEIYEDIMRKEEISKENFIIRQIPEISSEGNERDLIVDIKDLDCRYENDELNKGKLKAILEFSLPKGSYATLVVKKMFG
ncbi:tRNA pseudouridine(13) synthase TruD [Candidatus Woesearchaeota archaeon]|nr:tRNA pseudouridine(13) synthase TruD [Candidatus Woesearchaeota archaeon]